MTSEEDLNAYVQRLRLKAREFGEARARLKNPDPDDDAEEKTDD